MNLAQTFRVNARPFKNCLYFYERKFYACAHGLKVTQQWKSTLRSFSWCGPMTKKTTSRTHKWLFLEHWYWKINDICKGCRSLARTTRRLRKSSKLVANVTQLSFSRPSVDICVYLLLYALLCHRFTHSLDAFSYALFLS